MKNIFVEPYTPFDVRGKLIINKNCINWFSMCMIIVSLGIAGAMCLQLPNSLGLFPLFVLIIMPISFALDEYGWRALYPIKKKRTKVNIYGLQSIFNPWYSEDLAKVDVGYREKIIDYLDYLRQGGERSETAETHLNAWYKHAQQVEERREKRKDKDIASMFVNEEQLKAYRKALQDVEKASD